MDLLKDDYAYADKTRFIELIKDTNFPFIVRPRRFGKALFTQMLQAYYDKAEAEHFDDTYRKKVFVIIDEYDQFANAILSNDLTQFKRITSSKGFLKDFYAKLKEATAGPVARIFITGVTSISLDSMTSGFSIAKNVTTRSAYASLFGFTEAELKALIPQVIDLKNTGTPRRTFLPA